MVFNIIYSIHQDHTQQAGTKLQSRLEIEWFKYQVLKQTLLQYNRKVETTYLLEAYLLQMTNIVEHMLMALTKLKMVEQLNSNCYMTEMISATVSS